MLRQQDRDRLRDDVDGSDLRECAAAPRPIQIPFDLAFLFALSRRVDREPPLDVEIDDASHVEHGDKVRELALNPFAVRQPLGVLFRFVVGILLHLLQPEPLRLCHALRDLGALFRSNRQQMFQSRHRLGSGVCAGTYPCAPASTIRCPTCGVSSSMTTDAIVASGCASASAACSSRNRLMSSTSCLSPQRTAARRPRSFAPQSRRNQLRVRSR
jgi:hypothetical protein